MVKDLFLTMLTVSLIVIVSIAPACCKKDKKTTAESVSVYALFKSKCTLCHDDSKALSIHGSQETVLDLTKRMMKKGADISDVQAMSIAGFLSSPNRSVFNEACSACHDITRVLDAHSKGTLSKATVKRMKEKGATLSDKEEIEILDFINRYHSSPPPE
jgi:cytochrome c5